MLLKSLMWFEVAAVLLGELWLFGVTVVLLRLYVRIRVRLWRMRRRRRALA